MHSLDKRDRTRNGGARLLDVWAGRAPIRFQFTDLETFAVAKKYLAPARMLSHEEAFRGEALVSSEGVRIISGPAESIDGGQIPFFQLELLLIDWTLTLAKPGVSLHAGCVIYSGRPILFVTESGGGKSSLTLAAVRAGAHYITDDLLLCAGKTLSGLARAIRFKQIPAAAPARPPYLDEMDCESFVWERRGEKFITPIWTGPCPSLHEFDASNSPCVVVRVSRGKNQLSKLSEVERLVTLHEAAILRNGEYDGSLGPGPTYHLSWEEPTKAFALLAKELARP
jgi:hypothetical protein